MKNSNVYAVFPIIVVIFMFMRGFKKWEVRKFSRILLINVYLFLVMFIAINAGLIVVTMFVIGLCHNLLKNPFLLELVMMYFICFTLITFVGRGEFSLDKFLKRKINLNVVI